MALMSGGRGVWREGAGFAVLTSGASTGIAGRYGFAVLMSVVGGRVRGFTDSVAGREVWGFAGLVSVGGRGGLLWTVGGGDGGEGGGGGGDQFFDRDVSVAEAIGKFDDVRIKVLDPLTSVDMLDGLATGAE